MTGTLAIMLAAAAFPSVAMGQVQHSPRYGPVLKGLDVMDLRDCHHQRPNCTYLNYPGRRGNPSISSEVNGYAFYFLNAGNQRRFESNPWAYVPSYGGFCAYLYGDADCKEDSPFGVNPSCPVLGCNHMCITHPDRVMGPAGVLSAEEGTVWSMHGDRLFFFPIPSARDTFMENYDVMKPWSDFMWETLFNGTHSASQAFNNCHYDRNHECRPGGPPAS